MFNDLNPVKTVPKSRNEIIILILILFLSFFLRLSFLHEPFERDEGFYAYVGQEILRGAIPYKDVIEVKPPGIHYIYALIIAVFGSTVEAIRLFTAFYSLLTVLSIYWLSRYLYDSRAGLLAALCYGIFSSGPVIQGSSSNTEVFMVLPMVVSAYLFLRASDMGKRVYLSGSGFFAALAILIKPVALPNLLLILAFVSFKRKNLKDILWDILAFLAPPVLLALLTLSYFTYHNALEDLIYWTVEYAKMLGSPHSKGQRLLENGSKIASENLLLWLAAFPTSFWLLYKQRNLKGLFIVLFLPASFLGVSLPGWFFVHYFIQIIPPLSILAGIGFSALWEKRKLFYVCIPIILASLVYSIKTDYKYYLVYTPEETSTKKYGSDMFVNYVKISKYIKDNTAPSDYIFHWGWDPEIYFLSGRRAPNRFIAMSFVAGSKNPAAAIEEMADSIMAKKPKYVIVQKGREQWPGYYELSYIIDRNYVLEKTIAGNLIYRYKEI